MKKLLQKEKKSLSETEIEEIISKFIEWTKYQNDEQLLRWSTLAADINHSSLLRRILAEDKIYDYPPPVAFSYPNYQLLDKGTYMPQEVFRAPSLYGKNKLVIDQNPYWDIISEGQNQYIVAYGTCPYQFDLRKIGDRWLMEKIK